MVDVNYQRVKKTIANTVFVVGLGLVTIPTFNYTNKFAQEQVSLDEIASRNKSWSEEKIFRQYEKERKINGLTNGIGISFLTAMMYSSVWGACCNKNESLRPEVEQKKTEDDYW